jgi:hypothetical protein
LFQVSYTVSFYGLALFPLVRPDKQRNAIAPELCTSRACRDSLTAIPRPTLSAH